ncbi:MAG: hypothetical protein K6F40_01525 [Bacteroidales bacterium]|nr:hypothetical protein [Bacteroidales bacterium]
MNILILSGSPRNNGNTDLFDSILTQYQLCLNFFHIEDAGHVLVRGAKEKGGVRGTKAMEEAEALGRAIAQ